LRTIIPTKGMISFDPFVDFSTILVPFWSKVVPIWVTLGSLWVDFGCLYGAFFIFLYIFVLFISAVSLPGLGALMSRFMVLLAWVPTVAT